MVKQYQVFLLESENPNDIPVYLEMLAPLKWNIITFSKPEDFIKAIAAGTKPDLIIANYNIIPISLRTSGGEVNVANALYLIQILIEAKFIEKIPTLLLLNQQHSVEEYNHCNVNSIPYLTKSKFAVEHLVDILQNEIRSFYKDPTDFLGLIQQNKVPQMANAHISTPIDIAQVPMQSHFSIDSENFQLANEKQDTIVKKEAEVISFYNGGKGGVGKTTLATNFAALLASNGSRVLLIDGDFYGPNCYLLLKVRAQRTIIDLKHILNHLTDESFKGCIIKHDTGLDFLAGPTNPRDVELMTNDDLFKIVKFAKSSYDFIIIDLPPNMPDESFIVDAFSQLSDKIVGVTTQGYASMEGVAKGFQLMASDGVDPNKFYLCVNKLNPKINFDPESIASKITIKQDYVPRLKTGKIPVVGKIGSDENIEIYENLMNLYVLNSQTKFRKDMEFLVLQLLSDYKLNAKSRVHESVKKKEIKSSSSFIDSLKSMFSFGKKK